MAIGTEGVQMGSKVRRLTMSMGRSWRPDTGLVNASATTAVGTMAAAGQSGRKIKEIPGRFDIRGPNRGTLKDSDVRPLEAGPKRALAFAVQSA